MKRCLLYVFCLWLATSLASAATQITVYGTNLLLTSPWAYYNAADAPGGAYIATSFGPGSIQATVSLGQTIAPGTYSVYAAFLHNFDTTNTVLLGDGTSAVQNLNDSDVSGVWTTNVIVTTTVSTNIIRLKIDRTGGPGPLIIFAVYITSNTNETVLSDNRSMVFRYPGAGDMDNSAAVAGNLVKNGSFEAGLGAAWRNTTTDHAERVSELWVTNIAHSGVASVRVPCKTNDFKYRIECNPIRVASNKLHCASVWVRASSGQNYAWLFVENTYETPSGFTAVQSYNTGILVGTTWTLLAITNHILAYPDSEVFFALETQQFNGNGGAIYFDDLQAHEGTNAIYQAHAPFEFDVMHSQPTKVYWVGDTNTLMVRGYNTGAETTKTINYQIVNWTNAVTSGSFNFTAPTGASTMTFSLPTNQVGHYRATFWVANEDTEVEAQWMMIQPPTYVGTNAVFGSHTDGAPYQAEAMKRMGVEWNRGFSPGAFFRWEFAEPTIGNFVYFDTQVASFTNVGMQILANLGENLPAWAAGRTYQGTTNVVGTFQGGELVAGELATGRVAVVCFATNACGTALQFTNSVGLWSGTITGLTSGATADVRLDSYPNVVPFEYWDRFVSNLVTHYRSSVYAWEVWNEPNQDSETQPEELYAEMCRIAALRIRSITNGAPIVLGGGILTSAYLTNLYNRLPTGFSTNFDAWSCHLYPGNEGASGEFRTNVVALYGKPVWNTETGEGDRGAKLYGPFRQAGRYVIPPDAQYYTSLFGAPLMVAKNVLGSVGGGLAKHFYYDARQQNKSPNDWNSAQFSMIDYDDAIRVKGAIVAGIASRLNTAAGQGQIALKDSDSTAFLFLKSGGVPAVAFWGNSISNKTITLANNITAADVKIYDLMGNESAPASLALAYGRMPLICEGQGSLSLSNLNHAFTNGAVVARADTAPPNLATYYGPRKVTQAITHIRWLAVDDRDVPGVTLADGTTYRYKLNSGSFTDWNGDTWVNYSGLSTNLTTFTVEARDLSGNSSTNSISFGEVSTLPKLTIGGKVTIGGRVSIQ